MEALGNGAAIAIALLFFFFLTLRWTGPALVWTLETVLGALNMIGQP